MTRRLITVALVFAGGIAVAFAVLTVGCEGSVPALGTMCGHNALVSLIAITLGAWFVLGMATALYDAMRRK